MKANLTRPPGYDSKPSDYFEQARPEILPFVPMSCQRVLDVGCGQGRFGELLKQTRNLEVWGIEPVASAATIAVTKLDYVIEGMFTPEIDLPQNHFDAIFFNDVLEHLIDPSAALKLARKLLGPGGVVISSIPNIRHFPTLYDLVWRGRWDYDKWGILDKTHLRFFTRSSIEAMFREEGFSIENICGINEYSGVPSASKKLWRLYQMVNIIAGRKLVDLKYLQFAVVAKPTC